MRVALVTYNALAGDAIGNQVAHKWAFFRERGAEVRVFVEQAAGLRDDIRPCSRLATSARLEPEDWAFLESADLVVAEYGQHYALLEILPVLARSGPRIVIDYHGVTPPALWGPHNREALEKGVAWRPLVWCAGAVIVHSRFTERELHGEIGLPADRLVRVPYPVDHALFGPGAPEFDWRAEWGLTQATLLLSVGRLAPNKRVPLLVEAVAHLRDVSPPVHALIVGSTSDLYQAEANRCRELAQQLGVAERIHFAGPLIGTRLRDAYRSADCLVIASDWESFCIPVIEAMAAGLPVVASRSTVLPETVASAGLTFTAGSAEDLARQVRRVICEPRSPRQTLVSRPAGSQKPAHGKVAIVAPRFGDDFAGGEKTSLGTIARVLQHSGRSVELFTTTTRTTSDWRNELPEGSAARDGIPVHRFGIDPHDADRHRDIVQRIRRQPGKVTPALEQDYVCSSLHSTKLVQALAERLDEFDAVIVGPYLHGLTHRVAERCAQKTLLVPCFHDEPLARLAVWRRDCARAGGILYHSPEEKAWAEAELGINHPGGRVIGTFLDSAELGAPAAGRKAAGVDGPYLVYCGRYCEDKEVARLIEWARRYWHSRPGRFHFVFMGEGAVTIPREPWARDLGFVSERRKRDVLAGAAALVQLSQHESLSLVALEAAVQGVPVLASAGCAALAGHLARSQGGRCVADYEQFQQVLDTWWSHPEQAEQTGRRGQEYVRRAFGNREVFASRLHEAIADLRHPLRERLVREGKSRAAEFDLAAWRNRFTSVIDQVLHAEPVTPRLDAGIAPRTSTLSVPAGVEATLVAVRLTNRGTEVLVPTGPARTVIHSQPCTESGQACGPRRATALPALVAPGQTVSAVATVAVPREPGTYRVALWASCADAPAGEPPHRTADAPECLLRVESAPTAAGAAPYPETVAEVRAALAAAAQIADLPDQYVDVTEGWLARWKRWIKRKLLSNFKHAYVDVLSHQQSAYNQRLVGAVQELLDHCTSLEHAVQTLQDQVARLRKRRRRKRSPASKPLEAQEQ